MNIKYLFFSLSLLGIVSLACKREGKGVVHNAPEPQTPEEVVRLYQAYLDQNAFDKAKTLSTAKETARLEEVSRIVAAENQDSTRTNSIFLKLNCTVQPDSVRCACTIKDQYETYDTDFFLVRFKNRWLVDAAPQEELLFDEEELEGILDGMLEQMH